MKDVFWLRWKGVFALVSGFFIGSVHYYLTVDDGFAKSHPVVAETVATTAVLRTMQSVNFYFYS